MAADKFNLQDDERLLIAVEKHPLYNKSEDVYKEKDRKKNAWKKIDEGLGLEEGNQPLVYEHFMVSQKLGKDKTKKG